MPFSITHYCIGLGCSVYVTFIVYFYSYFLKIKTGKAGREGRKKRRGNAPFTPLESTINKQEKSGKLGDIATRIFRNILESQSEREESGN